MTHFKCLRLAHNLILKGESVINLASLFMHALLNSCQVGDFTGKFGPLPSYGGRLSVTDRNLSLSGQYSIVGRSFVVQVSESERVCGTIRSDTEGKRD